MHDRARPYRSAVDNRWQIWLDRGGTFTDALGRAPGEKRVRSAKVPSTDHAPLEAIRALIGLGPRDEVPALDLRMGTTVATNALLQRTGERCLVILSAGFEDALRIGTQARPDLFALDIERPLPLYERVIATGARATPNGVVLKDLEHADEGELVRSLKEAKAAGIRSVAVCLLGGFAVPALEKRVAAVAERVGFTRVVCSHQASAGIGWLARSETAVLDAYLSPLLLGYLRSLQAELDDARLWMMQSSGGLCGPNRFFGQSAVLSGPAGGAVAAEHLVERHKLGQAITFDMGGTSTDVSRLGPEGVGRRHQTTICGMEIRAPSVDIHTVAAGGGSICRFDGAQFTVGPSSVGADPGPLCYGKPHATEIAVTDLNVTLGRLPGDRFPFAIDEGRSRKALSELAENINATRHREGQSPENAETIAEGFVAIANAQMADAIQKVSVARGFDVREHALIVFGGAGGQHACDVARLLGVKTILLHPWAGVLSAWGMGLAQTTVDAEADGLRAALDTSTLVSAQRCAEELGVAARATLVSDFAQSASAPPPAKAPPPQVPPAQAKPMPMTATLGLRYRGSDTEFPIVLPAGGDVDQQLSQIQSSFAQAHERALGYRRDDATIEINSIRVRVSTIAAKIEAPSWPTLKPVQPRARRRVHHAGAWLPAVPVVAREELGVKQSFTGPAIVLDETSTFWLAPGFAATVLDDGTLRVVDTLVAENAKGTENDMQSEDGPDSGRCDPVTLALLMGAFQSIAEQMGEVLARSAQSTNIRERLDFSCAVFSADGELVANAPHIPVHLGAISETVKAVLLAHPKPKPGDGFIANDPAAGGSHLPDITLVSPLHDRAGQLLFWVASRGHHADIGGITPGSMPPFSSTLAEEGAVFRCLHGVVDGVLLHDAVRAVLEEGPWPARNPGENLADLNAQLAANETGRRLMLALAQKRGAAVVTEYMGHVQTYAAAAVARAISKLEDGERIFSDALDDGTPVVVRVLVKGAKLTIDFTGTGTAGEHNLNAPRAVTMAAVLYVLRVLAGVKIPLCSGCLKPVEVVIPPGSLLDPGPERAVCGGNVETSQRVVDVLLGALGLAAASQGTMNNLTLGDKSGGYYETLAGGAGATANQDGHDAVHTHMTNSRITDPEVLEERFPMRVLAFSIRKGSGGRGQQRGGDGLVRTIQATAPLQGAIVSQRRTSSPFGLAGGGPGRAGRNLVRGKEIAGCASFLLEAGDEVTIETPGGGGFGPPSDEASAGTDQVGKLGLRPTGHGHKSGG